MFGFDKKECLKRDTELLEQIEQLWFCHNNLAELVKNMTMLMRKMAEGMQSNKEDFDHLVQQTSMIAETQNKIISHLAGKQAEEYMVRDFSSTVH